MPSLFAVFRDFLFAPAAPATRSAHDIGYDLGYAASPFESEAHRLELLASVPEGLRDSFSIGLDHGTAEARCW